MFRHWIGLLNANAHLLDISDEAVEARVLS